MGCALFVAFCAGGEWNGGDTFTDYWSVGLMEMFSADEGCGDDPGSSCAFPFGSDSFEEGAVNICCQNGVCCSSVTTWEDDPFPEFIGCINSTINICEIETCLSEGDRCEDIEELICEDGYTNEYIEGAFDTDQLCGSSSRDDSEIFSAAAVNVQSHLEKSFGIDFSDTLHSKQSDGNSGLDRIVYMNGKPMTLREFIRSNGGELSDKMKKILGPQLVERYENIKNDNINNAKKEVNDDILNYTQSIDTKTKTKTKTKTVEISFGHYVFLSMFAIFGIIILSIGNVFYWCCGFTFKKNKI